MGFLNMTHRIRFSKIWSSFQHKSPRFIAAVFLLSSTEEIWSRAESCINKDGTLDISKFRIRKHFDGWHLDREIHLPVIEEFGIEGVNMVVASTLAHKDYDGRFSGYNRKWTSFVP